MKKILLLASALTVVLSACTRSQAEQVAGKAWDLANQSIDSTATVNYDPNQPIQDGGDNVYQDNVSHDGNGDSNEYGNDENNYSPNDNSYVYSVINVSEQVSRPYSNLRDNYKEAAKYEENVLMSMNSYLDSYVGSTVPFVSDMKFKLVNTVDLGNGNTLLTFVSDLHNPASDNGYVNAWFYVETVVSSDSQFPNQNAMYMLTGTFRGISGPSNVDPRYNMQFSRPFFFTNCGKRSDRMYWGRLYYTNLNYRQV